MEKPGVPMAEEHSDLRTRLIGLGERSFSKSYYPELQRRLDQLERFRVLLDCARDVILLAELFSRRIVDANLSACRQLGYSGEELNGLTLNDVVALDRLVWPQDSDPLSSGRMVSTVLLRSDGTEIPAEVDLSMDAFGDDSYVILVARDVAARLRAEESLRRSEAEKALILQSTEEIIAYHDTEQRMVWANRSASRTLNLPPDDLVGRHCWELWHGRQSPCRRCPVRRALKTGRPQRGEITGSGGRVWFIRAYPTRSPTGELEGVVEFCLDITERKKAEQALRTHARLKTEFISTAAHELRTPLTIIQGFSQLLLSADHLSAAEQREFLGYIHEKSRALSRLAADLLDIGRIEAGKGLSYVRTPCTPRELAEEAGFYFQALSSGHRLQLEITGDETGLEVDREKVVQVFENLLSNAVKYSHPGSTVRLSGHISGGRYEFTVLDQGVGMTPEQVGRVFDKFYRADSSNTAPSGFGLGMSVVRAIVEAHGGKIWVESRPNHGTAVRFTLPLRTGGNG